MTTSTPLVVLSKTNYSESSIVVQCYSQHFGKVGLLITGVKKKKAKIKSALFEPLSILEVHGDFEKRKGLVIPKEVKVITPLLQLQSSMKKRAIAFFLSEMLHKALFEALPDAPTYTYMASAISYLNFAQEGVSNFHILFLLKFSRYLGFQPMFSTGQYFDLLEGSFQQEITVHAIYFNKSQKTLLAACFGAEFDNMDQVQMSTEDRSFLLDFVLKYYQLHIPGMGLVKSHQVLEEIFH